jgi:mannosyltransferase OCH1-like enzyme
VKIPKIIHQIWIQGQASLPEIYRTASKTWQENNRDWNYTLWDGPALREFMATEAPEWLPLYDAQGEMEAKADVARYALLLVRGGLYADMDTECLRPAARLLERSQASLFLQVYDNPWTPVRSRPVPYERIANSVIASAPAHPIWRQVRAEIERNPWSWSVPARTGPLMFWPVAKSYAEQHVQDVCLWDHRRIFTGAYFPRAYMRWYSSIRRKICVLDFNDSGRKALVRELRRPHHLLAAIARDIARDMMSRHGKRSGPR